LFRFGLRSFLFGLGISRTALTRAPHPILPIPPPTFRFAHNMLSKQAWCLPIDGKQHPFKSCNE
jgi:hypothetical protein